MGRKKKEEDGQETYEVWISKTSGTWTQAVDGGNDGIFHNKKRALLIAGSKSTEEGVVETLLIERRLIASFNGPAISLKGRLAAAVAKENSSAVDGSQEKKEKSSADDLHGDRTEEGQVVHPGPEREGEAGASGSAGEAAAGG